MKLNFKVLLVSVVTVLLSGLWFFAGSLPVAAAQAKSDLTLTYEVQTDRQGKESLVLLAKLKRADGYPLSQREILYFENTDLYGSARISIGSATTSAVGVAALKYETRQAGEHQFTALYGGDETTEFAIVNATLDLQNLPALDPLEKLVGMEKISYWSMLGVGVVVLVVWSLLAGVFFGTIAGIRKGSKGQ
ncbi:MAG: Ig-like domain repeat protein [Dehalococcoidia bacterium]|nr:MAG: Ig-like domain repeat protein [Dehalococcoidia bacterium]